MSEYSQYYYKVYNRDINLLKKNSPYYYKIYSRGIDNLKLAYYQKAIKDFNEIINKFGSKFVPAYISRGHAYLKLGDSHLRSGGLNDYKKAIEDFNQGIIFNPRLTPAPVYLYRGIARSKLGNFQGAIVDYTEAIERNFTHPDVYYHRGTCHGKLGNHHEAIANFKQAIKLDPNYAGAYYNLGISRLILERHGDRQKAIKDFEKTKELAFKQKNKNLYKLAVKKLNEF